MDPGGSYRWRWSCCFIFVPYPINFPCSLAHYWHKRISWVSTFAWWESRTTFQSTRCWIDFFLHRSIIQTTALAVIWVIKPQSITNLYAYLNFKIAYSSGLMFTLSFSPLIAFATTLSILIIDVATTFFKFSSPWTSYSIASFGFNLTPKSLPSENCHNPCTHWNSSSKSNSHCSSNWHSNSMWSSAEGRDFFLPLSYLTLFDSTFIASHFPPTTTWFSTFIWSGCFTPLLPPVSVIFLFIFIFISITFPSS